MNYYIILQINFIKIGVQKIFLLLNIMDIIPLDILYETLLILPYDDIPAFIDAHPRLHAYRNDPQVWISKLNHDFTIQFLDGINLVPSDYIKRYPHYNDDRKIYQRWAIGLLLPFNKIYLSNHDGGNMGEFHGLNNNTDIIMYLLDRNRAIYNTRHDRLHVHELGGLYDLYRESIYFGNFDILNALYRFGVEWNETYSPAKLIIEANTSNAIQTLEWFEAHGFKFDNKLIPLIIHEDRLDILQWFYSRGIIADRDDIELAIRWKRTDIYEWLTQQDYTP